MDECVRWRKADKAYLYFSRSFPKKYVCAYVSCAWGLATEDKEEARDWGNEFFKATRVYG